MVIFTQAEVKTMIAAAKSRRYGALFITAVGTGLRQGELLGLNLGGHRLREGHALGQADAGRIKGQFIVKEPKSKRSKRTVSLPPFVQDALRQHRAKMLAEGNIAGPVFCSKGGGYLRKSNMIRQAWKPMLKQAELPTIRFHDLRHTRASLLLAAGESIKAVSQRLGHGTIDITLKTYYHLLPDADSSLSDRLQKMFG